MSRQRWLRQVEEALGVAFPQPEVLIEAFTHPSYANEQAPPRPPHNQRLEFLGDAVIGLAVGFELWRRLPHHPEGELARLRSAIVNEPVLAGQARRLDLGRHLRLGKGEAKTGGGARDSNLCDLFEAVCGAVFVAHGWEAAHGFIRRQLADRMAQLEDHPSPRDAKSRLQEHLQARGGEGPRYRLRTAWGPPHARCFLVEVLYQGKVLGKGRGGSKREAEKAAAADALARLAPTSRAGER